jgi:uncharacterized repeat protein (TIGR01451 family)
MRTKFKKAIQLIGIVVIGVFLVSTVVSFAHNSSQRVLVHSPIAPPEGYPKLSLSAKVVTPTLAGTDGAVLQYNLEIRNTGAYTASDVTLTDPLPANTVYNDDVKSSASPTPVFTDGVIMWEHGKVGFDDSVIITFSVTVTPGYEGIISNTAVINDPLIAEPVSVMAETQITDTPVFEISKSATPSLPGKSEPLTFELAVKNVGQPADNTPITVTDFLPEDTLFLQAGPGGSYDSKNDVINWHRSVDLGVGETSIFTYSVNFPITLTAGTVITNSTYFVSSPDEPASYGEPFTTTVVDPNLILSKSIYPDPPGSNSEVTYTLTVFNLGSLATDLVITDTVPAGVQYLRGGDSYENGVVTWHLASLDTRESTQLTFTGYIADVAGIVVLNDDYGVCSAEGVCAMGNPVPSLIVGPTFNVTAALDPIAHKPGGGKTETVTPTFTIENMGPGDALEATALLTFGRISISNVNVLKVIPTAGTLSAGPTCNETFPCVNYLWTGDLAVGEMITITTIEGQSTIGGEEGTPYTATVVVTDELGSYVTEPVQATAVGHVTHMSNLIPTKTAPAEIGPGQDMTYTIRVFDSGLSTEMIPTLTETVPSSVTLLSISDGGISQTVDGRTIIAWTLPAMGPGDYLFRSFGVRVDPDLVSGTLIVNDQYQTGVYESYIHGIKIVSGEPVTTTIHEVGLIDSYKEVTPVWSMPGKDNILTYTVHVVNSGPNDLVGVQVNDIFPWEHTTYQRDAVASAGSLISDIVSLEWTGDLAPYSQQVITFTTLVDDFFEGVVTNTATITHTSLTRPVEVSAVAYITDDPVLFITKEATPDPVMSGGILTYHIEVSNLGQQASLLTITDTVPVGTTYVDYSASSGGQLVGNTVKWTFPVLNHDDTLHMSFQVLVGHGDAVYNELYAVNCAEGVYAYGDTVITPIYYAHRPIYLPIVSKN